MWKTKQMWLEGLNVAARWHHLHTSRQGALSLIGGGEEQREEAGQQKRIKINKSNGREWIIAIVKQQVICKSMHILAVPVVIGRSKRNGANEGTGRRRAGTESFPPSAMVGTTPCRPVSIHIGSYGGACWTIYTRLYTWVWLLNSNSVASDTVTPQSSPLCLNSTTLTFSFHGLLLNKDNQLTAFSRPPSVTDVTHRKQKHTSGGIEELQC